MYTPLESPQRISLLHALRAARVVAGALVMLVLATPVRAQILVNAGVDLFRTPGAGSTSQDFSGTPIPANFFNPGSLPFDGTVYFQGVALAPPLGPTDTVVRRNLSANVTCNGPGATVPIEIVALSLVSVNPITVRYGNNTTEQWNVRVGLSSVQPQQLGTMTIKQSGTQGGTFSSTLPVSPRLIFTRIGPPQQVVMDPIPPIQFTSNGYWVQSMPPTLGVCTTPGGVLVDHDQNPETPPVPVGATSNFVAGGIGLPMNCIGAPAGYGKTMTVEEALWAKHGVLPPQCVIPPQEGASFIGDKCMITTPAMAAAMGATYLGDNTVCLGDRDGNGRDDALPAATPGLSPWGMYGLLGLLIALAGWFLIRGRESAPTQG